YQIALLRLLLRILETQWDPSDPGFQLAHAHISRRLEAYENEYARAKDRAGREEVVFAVLGDISSPEAFAEDLATGAVLGGVFRIIGKGAKAVYKGVARKLKKGGDDAFDATSRRSDDA